MTNTGQKTAEKPRSQSATPHLGILKAESKEPWAAQEAEQAAELLGSQRSPCPWSTPGVLSSRSSPKGGFEEQTRSTRPSLLSLPSAATPCPRSEIATQRWHRGHRGHRLSLATPLLPAPTALPSPSLPQLGVFLCLPASTSSLPVLLPPPVCLHPHPHPPAELGSEFREPGRSKTTYGGAAGTLLRSSGQPKETKERETTVPAAVSRCWPSEAGIQPAQELIPLDSGCF